MSGKNNNGPARVGSVPRSTAICFAIVGLILSGPPSRFVGHEDQLSLTETQQPDLLPAATGATQPSRLDSQPLDLNGYIWRVAAGLGLVLAIIFVGARYLKGAWGDRLSNKASLEIEVLGRKFFGAKQSLVLIRVRQRQLLLGVTDQSINFLYELGPERTPAVDFQDGRLELVGDR